MRLYILLIDSFHELPNDERYTLNPLDLLLCPDQLALEAPLLILDVLFLEVDVSAPVSHLGVEERAGPKTHSSCLWSFLKVE